MILWRRIFLLIFVLISVSKINAQEVEVKNVTFTQEDERIIIRYDLKGDFTKKYTIDVSLSEDYGNRFRIHPEAVRGDVGKNVRPGYNKEIIWEMIKDFPNGIEGEGFVFAIDAKLQKSGGGKTLYYLLGAGVVGGVVYFVTQSSKSGGEDKGTISITIPGEME